jgi:hypothetical protein
MANLQQNPPHKKIAFVLGNGVSRLAANLDALKNYGTVYGCNALYREFQPDHLVAVDVKMINEIIEVGYHLTNSVWTNKNKGVISFDSLNVLNPHKGWSSGPTALWLSTLHLHTEIYILGFDYQGVNGKVNNVYAGTQNYKKENQPATFFGNWSSQTERIVVENPKITFYRVYQEPLFLPANLEKNLENFKNVTYREFETRFNGCTYFSKNNQKSTI